jgi:hypothetical protein
MMKFWEMDCKIVLMCQGVFNSKISIFKTGNYFVLL